MVATNRHLDLLGAAVAASTSVSTLCLSHSDVGMASSFAFMAPVAMCQSLTALDLGRIRLSGPESTALLAAVVGGCRSLVTLVVSGNRPVLDTLLPACTRLETLDLSNCGLTPAAGAALAAHLPACRQLVSLNLDHNRLGAAGTPGLVAGVLPLLCLVDVSTSKNALAKKGAAHVRLVLRRNKDMIMCRQVVLLILLRDARHRRRARTSARLPAELWQWLHDEFIVFAYDTTRVKARRTTGGDGSSNENDEEAGQGDAS